MMNFNPLFIGQSNTAGTISSSAAKLGKSSYLFSDIIKVILEDDADLQLASNISVSELNKNNSLALPTEFQNIPEAMTLTKSRISSDFIGLSTEENQTSMIVETDDASAEHEIELNRKDLQGLFLSLAGYTPEIKAGITAPEIESIDKLVTTINKMNTGETLSVQVDGLEEQLHVEITKNENQLKEFTAKFVIASADSQTDIKLPLTETIITEKNHSDTVAVKEREQNKFSNSDNQAQVNKAIDSRASNETKLLNENEINAASLKLVQNVNKSENQTVSNQTNSDLRGLTEIKEAKPELNNIPVNNISKNEVQLKTDSFTKNVTSGTIPFELKSNLNSKETKTETKPTVKIDSAHSEQKNIKRSNIPEKSVPSITSKPLSNETEHSPKTIQSENVNRIQTSDTQKVVRLTLNNPEQVNLREVLNSISKGEVKNTDSNVLPKLSFKENIPAELKSEVTTKLEQNLVRVNSKVMLDEAITSKPEIKFAKNLVVDSEGNETVKEDSFAKITILNKQMVSGKTIDKSGIIQSTQTSEKFKPAVQTNSVDVEFSNENKPLISTLNELVNKSNDGIVKEFKPLEKSVSETSNVKSPSIQEKNNLTDTVRTSKVQTPIKESADIKQNEKSFHIETKLNLNKVIIVDDKKLSNVQIPVKESVDIKQNTKELLSESNNHLNKDLKIDSTPKESFLKNSGEENNNNFTRHEQNHYQENDTPVISSDQKNPTHISVAKNNTEKHVQESTENTNKESSPDNTKVELNPKPVAQQSNILSKEKIISETRNLNETVKTIRSSEIVKELTNFVKNGETQTVTFKVVPENLGRIKVSLDVANHIAKATIEVETETVKQVVQSNIESLKQALTQSGITVDAINVSLTGNQQKPYRPVDSKRKMNDNSDENKIATDSDVLLRKNLGYNTYEYLI